jgi:hypothetical protein
MSLKGIRVTPVVVALVPRRPVAVRDSNRANTEPNNGTSKPQDEQASEGEGECVFCGVVAHRLSRNETPTIGMYSLMNSNG